MSANVKLFASTDTGAPVLDGLNASGIAVLDACLKDGYNPKTITGVTRSGSVATATCTGHGYIIGDCLLQAGFDQAEYNGEVYVTGVIDANTYTFTVSGTPATPATGATLTAKKAPAGWTKPFSGTNLAVYRQGSGNQRYMRVDDNVATTTNICKVTAYEAMTDVNTGTGQFPTTSQLAGGIGYIWKSDTASSATRPWILLANDKYFILITDPDGIHTKNHGVIFGDFPSTVAGDAFNTIWLFSGTAAITQSFIQLTCGGLASITNHYIPRGFSQSGTCIYAGKHSDAAKQGGISNDMGTSGFPYPHGPDQTLLLGQVWVNDGATPYAIRGRLPGLWCPLHNKPKTHLATHDGTGVLAGKKFLVVNIQGSAQIFLETSNTWYN